MPPAQRYDIDQWREGSTAISFLPEPHTTSMAVWDVPSPIEIGGQVKVKVGVKCHADCMLEGARIQICDSEGKKVAEGRLGGLPLPGTDSLYWTEVEFKASGAEGYHEWTSRFLRAQAGVPHKEAAYNFGLMMSLPVRHLLSVSATDSVTMAPLDNAYIRVGGYTLFTDGAGTAKVSVAGGRCEFVAWKRNYKMSRTIIDVVKDEDLKVELLHSPCKYCPDST